MNNLQFQIFRPTLQSFREMYSCHSCRTQLNDLYSARHGNIIRQEVRDMMAWRRLLENLHSDGALNFSSIVSKISDEPW